jgi:plasmid stability protein
VNKDVVVSTRLDHNTFQEIKAQAAREGRSFANMVRELLRRALK